MSKLDDFLNLADVNEIRDNITVNVGGKDFTLTIRPLTEAEHLEFQRRSNVITKNKITFDSGKYSNLVIEACIVEPNFRDADFLKRINCVSATEFINRKFPAGVVSDISEKIQKLSGFESYNMEIENAKN